MRIGQQSAAADGVPDLARQWASHWCGQALPRHLVLPTYARYMRLTSAQLALRSHAFERLDALAVVIDDGGVIVDSNEAWRLFAQLNEGTSGATGIGVNYLEVCDRAARDGDLYASEVAKGLRAILAGDRLQFDFDYPCDGPTESTWFHLQGSFAPVSHGAGAFLLHSDITARKLRERQLEDQSEKDFLTGLPNRAAAHRELDALLAATDGGRSASVMFVDLDGFKAVNDTYGHHVGDELLAKVSSRLRHAVRPDDIVCRFGGDEFVVVCSNLEPDQAKTISVRIETSMRQPFQIGAEAIVIGASVGCSTNISGSTVESMLEKADRAMYVSKARNSQPVDSG